MTTSHKHSAHSHSARSLKHLIPGAMAALAIVAAAPSYAYSHAFGDATAAEQPWVRPGVEAPLQNGSAADAAATSAQPLTRAQVRAKLLADRAAHGMPIGDSQFSVPYTPETQETPSTLTRAEVRDTLTTWRAAGLLTPSGDIGDTNETLQRREEFYALQTEVIVAERIAEQAAAAQAAAELAAATQAADEQAMQLAALRSEGALDLPEPVVTRPTSDGQMLSSSDAGEVVLVEIDD